MNQFDLFIFDLDGVLYRGNEPIPNADKSVSALRQRNKQIRFLTNNSSKTREEYAQKLNGLGFEAQENEIYSSAYGAAKFLQNLKVQTVHVLGEDGLRHEITDAGMSFQEPPEWVVAGICWKLTYAMLDEAQTHLRNGAKFLATNQDATFPDEGGRIRPGAGAIIAALSTCVNKQPDYVIGKPNPFLIDLILEEAKVHKNQVLLIGDRVDTDIVAARNAGITSALVLTGVATKADQNEADFCFESVENILI